MTADPRAVEIIAEALWRLDGIHITPDGPDEYHRSNAEALLAKFTAAGWSLLPPGGQASTEHAIRWESNVITRFGSRKHAEVHLAGSRERDTGPDDPARYGGGDPALAEVVSRTVTLWPDPTLERTEWPVHTTPWQPSDTPGEPA